MSDHFDTDSDLDSTIDSFMANISLPSSIPDADPADFDIVDPILLQEQEMRIQALRDGIEIDQVMADDFLPQQSISTPEPPSVMFSFPSIEIDNLSQFLDCSDDIGEPIGRSTPIPSPAPEPIQVVTNVMDTTTISDAVTLSDVVTIYSSDSDSTITSNSESFVQNKLTKLYQGVNKALDKVGVQLKKLRNFDNIQGVP